MMARIFSLLFLCLLTAPGYALTWVDLWKTKDQQAWQMMQKKQYKEARDAFHRKDWAGVAAYRAGDYKKSFENFSKFQNEQGYYNQGNALAHTGDYEKAIEAYNNALAINPQNQDALFNRNLIKEQMKKDKEKENQQNKNQQNKDQQNKEQQNKDQQNKDQQNKDQQNKDQQNKDQQNKNQQNKDQQNKDQQNKDQQNKNQQNKDQQNKAQQNKDQQDKDKQNRNQQNKDKQNAGQQNKNSREKAEEQAAKEQWLKLVPDDPGGLMRQKFLRDYLRRQGGWN